MAYGHIYLTTPDGTVNWAVDDTYEKLTLATTAGPLKDFTHTTPNKLTYTGTLSRTFEIQASISARTPAGSTQKNTFAIFKNGTLVPGSFQTLRAQTAEATPNNANPMTMVTLANGDYIEIYGQVPGAGIDSEIANLALSVRELTR